MADQISYDIFYPILSSVIHKKTSDLFSQLSRNADIFELLKTYDYFNMKPIPVPCIKSISPMSYDRAKAFLEEHGEADASEQYETVAQFLVAIANGKYDFSDSNIVKVIYDSLIDILAHSELFGPRLRYHTLNIMENYCWNRFTNEQQALLLAYKRSFKKLPDHESDIIVSNIKFTKDFKNPFFWIRKSVRQSYEVPPLVPLQSSMNPWILYKHYDNNYFFHYKDAIVFRICSPVFRVAMMIRKLLNELLGSDQCWLFDQLCPRGYLYPNDEELYYTSLNHRHDQIERKLKHSDRPSHWIKSHVVDKFKNRPTDKPSKYHR